MSQISPMVVMVAAITLVPLNVPLDRPETATRSAAVKGPSRSEGWALYRQTARHRSLEHATRELLSLRALVALLNFNVGRRPEEECNNNSDYRRKACKHDIGDLG